MTQLREKNIEAFLPTITRWSRWKDRKKRIDWPLFPGYCFVRIAPQDALPVLKCTGVVEIISNQGVLAAVPDQEVGIHPHSCDERVALRPLSAD